MEYLFDTADIGEIEKYLPFYPVHGVTTNPSLIKKLGAIDFFPYFQKMRSIIGLNRSLHIQATESTAEGIINEAHIIRDRIDDRVFIKIPVNEAGLRASKILKQEGFGISATGIYTKAQAFLALETGADNICMYYNRMLNMEIDPADVFSSVANLIERDGYSARILAASFKNIGQVNNAIDYGAKIVTVAPSILHDAMNLPAIQACVDAFQSDWQKSFGNVSICDLA